MNGGSEAPQLTGLSPAQAPRLTVTGEADWRPLPRLTLAAEARYEAKRFNDDLNTQPLAAATTVAAQARWRLTDQAEVYLAADNLFSTRVETDETATGVFSYRSAAHGAGRVHLAAMRRDKSARYKDGLA